MDVIEITEEKEAVCRPILAQQARTCLYGHLKEHYKNRLFV